MVGVSNSIVSAREVTEVFNNVVVSNLQSCSSNNSAVQVFQVNGNANLINDIVLDQNVTIDYSCFGTISNQTQILNDIINQLASNATATSDLNLGLSFAGAINFSSIANEVVSNATVSNVQKCVTDFNVQQAFQVNGNFNQIFDVALSQDAQTFTRCAFGTDNVIDISNKISNDLNASANAQAGLGLGFVIMIIIILLVVGAVVLLVMFKQTNFRQLFSKQQSSARRRKATDYSRSNIRPPGNTTPGLGGAQGGGGGNIDMAQAMQLASMMK